jgi:DNA-binding MarR family transcriptional regulator
MATDGLMEEKKNKRSKRTVRLSEGDVKAAQRVLTLLLETDSPQDNAGVFGPATVTTDTADVALLARARMEFENRRRRSQIFGPEMFGEPAWDMLLALFIQDAIGPRLTAGSLLHFSSATTSTGKRWLELLARRGFIIREDHPTDARTYYVRMSEKARDALKRYLSVTIDTAT